jgi:hypothetical protein
MLLLSCWQGFSALEELPGQNVAAAPPRWRQPGAAIVDMVSPLPDWILQQLSCLTALTHAVMQAGIRPGNSNMKLS